MAGLIHKITVTEELRPAYYFVRHNGQPTDEALRCMVHTARRGEHGGFVCELETGNLVEGFERNVRFLDSAERFGEIAWEAMV